jgi:hypothetical protein
METTTERQIANQIVHVLFVDIAGYSTGSVDAQSKLIQQLNAAVQSTPSYQRARTQGTVFALATGDGSALVFLDEYDQPARCALELECVGRKDAGANGNSQRPRPTPD